MTNLGEIKSDILEDLQDPNSVSLSPKRVVKAINEAIEFYKRHQFKFNFVQDEITLAADSTSIPLPSNFLSPSSKTGAFVVIDNDNPFVMTSVSPIEFNNYIYKNLKNRPEVYSYVNESFMVAPIPDKDYTLKRYYLIDVPLLVNDSDSNVFTLNAESMIRNYASATLTMSLQQDEKMGSYFFGQSDKFAKTTQERSKDTLSTGRNRTHSAFNRRYR